MWLHGKCNSVVPSADNLHELMHPPDRVYKGGEGIQRIVDARENDHRFLHQNIKNKYWYVENDLIAASFTSAIRHLVTLLQEQPRHGTQCMC